MIDGIDLSRMHVGEILDVPDTEARILIAEGWAEPVQSSHRLAPILIIEDDAQTRRILAEWVRAQGYEVVEARDGREGLAALVGYHPAVVLLDLGLPLMDGCAFCKAQQLLGGAFAHVPIVIVSGRDDADEQAARLGASAVLHKPLDYSELVTTIAHQMTH
jgi:DNA-binding response OmpR family regulator